MVIYHINDFKSGLKIIQNNEPCIILHAEAIKPGKGQAFSRVRFKQIKSGKILEKTVKSGDFFESADLVEVDLVYIYNDNIFWYFINEKNFEEIAVAEQIIGNNVKWMVNQLHYAVTLWNSAPILVVPPEYIGLKIINTSISTKKRYTASLSGSSGIKLATVSTGAIIKVPLFIQSGDVVKVNTRSGIYVSRIR
ncbi:elongation factor P [Candidatus Blochmannia ocreatus (nom. nud.)]|uniref:Elongation factor P n=1 Tax=Candidatus Blochmannia ocreatus (nom. nud.) TaxID=251538 RepID=A0ABY4SZ99_9ENTR|nr:elongation factor P [Candidatus Blochmannia ocreatus]URJ25159.1 elongation factor P [Candidatus Blochmannia ocreatus]